MGKGAQDSDLVVTLN